MSKKSIIKIGKKIRSLGVHTLTMWAFSTENWNRSREEVSYLMKMYETFIDKNLRNALKEKIKLIHLGRKDRISKRLLKKIQQSEEKTKDFIHLSGSGSALFMTFSNRKGAGGLLEKVKKAVKGCRFFLVHTA